MKLASMQWIRFAISLCFVGLALCEGAHAQVSSALLGGTVTDNSGAVIAGAHVTVVNTGTGATRTADTNATGDFIIPALDPGSYTVTVNAAGFEKAVNTVTLTVGDKKSLKFPLAVGTASQSVVVTSTGELINTTSAEISTVVDQAEVKELPLNGRDPSSLVLLDHRRVERAQHQRGCRAGGHPYRDRRIGRRRQAGKHLLPARWRTQHGYVHPDRCAVSQC